MENISADNEEWRPAPEWERSHSVSSLGRVRAEARQMMSRNQTVKRRTLKQQVDKWGYHYVFLHCDGRHASRNVHILVAGAFIGPRPEGMQTDHIDHNKGNNSAANLRYLTPSENILARMATGCGVGDRNGRAKLQESWINPIRRLHRAGLTHPEIGRAFGVHPATIFGVIHRRCWGHVPDPDVGAA